MASSQTTDTLVKPDMKAVLSRTHLDMSSHSFLLPILEAVSNGMHGIEARFGKSAATKGRISLHFRDATDPNKLHITVEDNGVGLNQENYRSFKTPFSGYKLKQNGRGFGRFIAFKVFGKISYATKYEQLKAEENRHFEFDIHRDKELIFIDEHPSFDETGLRVSFKQPLSVWNDLVRGLDQNDVADEIGSHFLPQFLYGWLPKVTIQFDDQEPENITQHFKEIFVQSDSGSIDAEIDGETTELEYSIAKIPKTRSFKNHCLLLSAADRIVGSPRDLSTKLGQPFFEDEEGKRYIVIAVVKSKAFETRLNDSRTGINISAKAVETIISEISDVIKKDETEQVAKIKTVQTHDLDEALRVNPILRIGLRGKSINDYVSQKPMHWTSEEFISDLAIERSRATRDLNKSIVRAAADAENYTQKIASIVTNIDNNKKEALAEYIIHRKNIIELIEAARKFTDDGKRSPEDVVHDLIFRRFSDSTSTDFFEHNLWLIDDLLAFMPYVSSDRTMHGGRRSKGDKVADLAFFDDSLVLGDHDGTTITIVEFKRPSRDDYKFGNSKSDPVMQVIDTLEQATSAGGITKKDGEHFTFSNPIRRFAYIIADHTSSMVDVLKKHDFRCEWNPKIFFRYRDNEQIYIQAIGYDTLVENAKKRNQAFFSVLLGE